MKLKYITLLFLVFILFQLNGQIANKIDSIGTDSIYQLLAELEGTKKIDTLNSIAYRVTKGFPDSCRKLASQIIIMSDSLDYQKGLADGYRNLGHSYLYRDSLFPAMINLLNAERIYEQIDPSLELGSVYAGLSFINKFAGRFRSNINYEQKAIKLYKQINAIEYLEMRYSFIARAYLGLGEYDSAIYYNKISLSYADSSLKSFPNNTFGSIYLSKFYESGDTSMLDKSVEWFIKGLNSPVINHHRTAAINANLFHAYYAYGNKGKDSLALYHARQAIASAVKTKDAFYSI